MFNNAPGFFTSVNLSIPENSTWELEEGLQVPHLCTLSFEFTYIGKENPTMQSMHYDNISDSFPSGKEPAQPQPEPQTRAKVRRSQRAARRERFREDKKNMSRRDARELRRARRRGDRQTRQKQFG